jgi:hypothetical protein
MSTPRKLHPLVEYDSPAGRIVSALVDDLAGRHRFRQAWFAIGANGQKEIVERWIALVADGLPPEETPW